MMGDLKKRASFAKVVNYVNNPKKARLIDSKDVRLEDNTTIARSMQGQADDKPGRKLKNPGVPYLAGLRTRGRTQADRCPDGRNRP